MRKIHTINIIVPHQLHHSFTFIETLTQHHYHSEEVTGNSASVPLPMLSFHYCSNHISANTTSPKVDLNKVLLHLQMIKKNR